MKHSSVRRQVVVAVALLLITAVAVGGWVAGSRVRSPDAAAAQAEPPDPSLITAPVELRVLSSRVVARGNVVPGQSATVSGPSSEDGATVTGVPVEVGDELLEGDVVVVVSGRPVVVLEGQIPAFRTMRPGMSGSDVDQLHTSLDRLNCDTAADEGVYGEATKDCVTRLYDALGYALVLTSDDEAEKLATAREEVATAEQTLQTSQAALDKATEGPTEADALELQLAVDAARRKIEDTLVAGAAGRAEAAAAIDAAMIALNKELANNASTPADRAKAEAELEAAVLKAETADREATEADAAAVEGVRLAEAKLVDLTEPKDVQSETVARDQAQGSLDRATSALADLEARTGPTVPLGEVVFVSALPATVSTLSAEVGQAVGGSSNQDGDGSGGLAVLATSALQVEAYVPASDGELVSVGMDVELLHDTVSTDDPVAATLTSLGDQVESSDDGSTRGFPAVIGAVDDLPRSWTGESVRVTFTAAATAGEVFVVPVAALSSGADGEARVEVVGDDGSVLPVPVEAGLSAEGFVEVTPIGDGVLNEGDQVVVGNNS